MPSSGARSGTRKGTDPLRGAGDGKVGARMIWLACGCEVADRQPVAVKGKTRLHFCPAGHGLRAQR